MFYLITILIIIICILLVLVVMVQNPKGGGLASEFSSASQIGGVQKTADFLEKATWGLAIALFVLSLFSAGFNSKTTEGIQQNNEESVTNRMLDENVRDQNQPVMPSQKAQPQKSKQKQQGGGEQ